MSLAVNITVFFIFQIIAALLFKWGSTTSHLYWWGFALGNLFGASSIITLINIYKLLNHPNVVVGISSGGSFMLVQIAMYWVYRKPLSCLQWGGIAMIFAGIIVVAFCNQHMEPFQVKTPR